MTKPASALLLAMLLAAMSPHPVSAANHLVSVGSLDDSSDAVIAGNGRYVVFESSGQLVAADTNSKIDVYRRDMLTGTIVLVSVNAAGTGAGDDDSYNQVVSAAGQYVAFESLATSLVANDANALADVFLRDIVNGTTTLISRRHPSYGPGSSSAAGASGAPSISSDGRYIAFQSAAASTDLLLAGVDPNTVGDVYAYDRVVGSLQLISKRATLTIGDGNSTRPFISGNGQVVVFQSDASNLSTIITDGNGQPDVFAWDRLADSVQVVSLSSVGPTTANAQSVIGNVTTLRRVINNDGNKVVFESNSTNLVTGQSDANGGSDVFLHDLTSAITKLVSHVAGSSTTTGNGTASTPAISSFGNSVVFESNATNVVAGQSDVNGSADLFLYDSAVNSNVLVSGASGSSTTTGNGASCEAAINADGSAIAFASTSTNLVAGLTDTNGAKDVFVRGSGILTLISNSTVGTTTTGNGLSDNPDINLSGLHVAYESQASNLVVSDTNLKQDVFISGRYPAINVVKLTNGTDNNAAPGPFVPVGSTVTFTYTVTNPGDVTLQSITITHDNGTPGTPGDDVTPGYVSGDTNTNGQLETTETWTYSATRSATPGQHTNTATVSGLDTALSLTVSDSDTDNHFGSAPGINVVKLTNGTDNNTAPGPFVPVGSTVTFTYNVSNPGNAPLSGVVVRDDAGSGSTVDDFNATFAGGDANANGLLDVGETWTFTASRFATPGQYTNNATATGTPPVGSPVSDSDVDHHFGGTATDIPTMEAWMLMLMAAMLGVIAAMRLSEEVS
jgi:uncharacterized repeat protein (TIGR01451 family)